MQKYSYLTKLIMFGCILCTVPVIFFGILSYLQSSNEIQKQVNRGQIQLLTQMNSNVEQILRTINHAFDQLVNSPVMAKVLSEPFTADDFMLYKDLRKEISNTQSFYTKVEDVVIVNIKQDWMIKNSGFYTFSDYLHHFQIANQMLLPSSTSWVLNPSIWFYSEEKANAAACPYTISLVKKLPDQSLDKYGLAFTNLTTCSLAEILNYTPRESETIMILDDQERILFHSDPGMIGKYAINTEFIKNPSVLSQSSGQYQTEVDKQMYTVTYLRSSYNNWIYLSAISIDSLTQDSKQIGRNTLVVCLIIVAVFVIISWLGSRQMYNPIERLMREVGGKSPGGGGKRSNEFDIISSQVQDLFQSKNKLEKEAQQHLQQALAYFLIKMFQGKVRRGDLMEKMEQFGFSGILSEWKIISVITLQIDTLENTRYGKEDLELLLFAINNIIEEIIPAGVRLPPVFIEQTQVTMIGGDQPSEEFNGFMFKLTESIQQTVHKVLGLEISIGISLPFTDPKLASVAYREGLEALKQRIHLGGQLIISYANINEGKHQLNLDYPYLTESELLDAILLADEDNARQYLSNFMKIIFKHEMPPQEYQISMVRLFTSLMVSMQESGVALNQLMPRGSSLYEELNALQMTTEIEEWFWVRVISPLISIYRDRQNSQYHSISEKIIDMIHKHYDTDLTIEQCAAQLHYNANYLSGIFRKETNTTFSDYLSAYRFNMAKKWLTETDMTIKDIAERLRYLNSQNFIRSFRKLEGVTPGQYRESFRKRGQ
ncbi:HTH-type transcriptional regulator YesS [Paenibacillus konkukensis]|uniref:HTH-type transcriptional regulator YesS n=1 Tax=Paenibacillus konkukensis TaxID=2020716 RepID=A0ABY4RNZ9_9BACL|nr:AraC family transcriptional regulator [Paenibacillus konkukensis]UQZ83735.1 HTH-type transcriptional regulator YesS [Paenibacillus konkukensis]